MTSPIPVRVTRYRCPHCPRTASSRARSVEHMARCWRNPEARGCKTCRHFEPAWSEPPDWTTGYGGSGADEACGVDVDLTGRPACDNCHGTGEELGGPECPECGGDGAEVKPGPIVHCEKWEAVP